MKKLKIWLKIDIFGELALRHVNLLFQKTTQKIWVSKYRLPTWDYYWYTVTNRYDLAVYLMLLFLYTSVHEYVIPTRKEPLNKSHTVSDLSVSIIAVGRYLAYQHWKSTLYVNQQMRHHWCTSIIQDERNYYIHYDECPMKRNTANKIS